MYKFKSVVQIVLALAWVGIWFSLSLKNFLLKYFQVGNLNGFSSAWKNWTPVIPKKALIPASQERDKHTHINATKQPLEDIDYFWSLNLFVYI